jgi:hypothetical protein
LELSPQGDLSNGVRETQPTYIGVVVAPLRGSFEGRHRKMARLELKYNPTG